MQIKKMGIFASMKTRLTTLFPHYTATLKLGFPIAVGQLGVIILGFIDTMMVGQYSTEALAAASFVNNLFTLITFLMMGYSYGITPLVSAHCGRSELEEAGSILKNGMASGGIFAAIVLSFMSLLYFFVDQMGQPEELLPLVRPYYLIILLSMVFVMLFNMLRQFTDGTTDTTSGMWCLLAGNAMNILGNWLLIGGVGPFPEWGLMGAGVATLTARIMMFVLLAIIVIGRKKYAPYRRGFLNSKIERAKLLHINKHSFPISIQMGLESGSFTFSAIMAGWIGAIELAAFQILVTIGTLGFLLYYSFGAGMSIRIATFVGMGDWLKVKLAAKAGSHIQVALAILSSTAIYIFALPLVEFFTPDSEVIALSLSLIGLLLLYQFGDAMQICYANAVRGTSHVKSMMKIAFISYLLIGIPIGYILGFPLGWGIHGIFFAFSVGLLSAAIQFYIQFRRIVNSESIEQEI